MTQRGPFILSSTVALAAVLLVGCAPRSVSYADFYSSPHEFLTGIYQAQQRGESAHNARIAVVPHHLVSPEAIALGISALPTNIERIILLSPDHFHHCPTLLCTVNGSFATQLGSIHANTEGVGRLARSSIVTVEPQLFRTEHGIHAVLPFIAYLRPKAEIVPVVLSQKILWKNSEAELRRVFGDLLDEHTALVVSSDFSHYLPLPEADRKDAVTERAILSGDLDAIAQLKNPQNSDCPGCLWIAASVAKEQNLTPTVLLHTNSARLLGNEAVTETTSHYAIVYE